MPHRPLLSLILPLLLLGLTACHPGGKLEIEYNQVDNPKNAFGPSRARSELAQAAAGFELYKVNWLSEKGYVTATLGIPADAEQPVPVAVLVHGWQGDRGTIASLYARPFAERGLGFLSVDLPRHGARSGMAGPGGYRPGSPVLDQGLRDLERSVEVIEWLGERLPVDPERIGYAGFSMGSFVGVPLVAQNDAFDAVVLNVGGLAANGVPLAPIEPKVEDAAEVYEPKPTLMLNGKHDRNVLPQGSRDLYTELPDPKQIIWYDSGHKIPLVAFPRGANFLAEHLGAKKIPVEPPERESPSF